MTLIHPWKILTRGEKITREAADVLKRMKAPLILYGPQITLVYRDGVIYHGDALNISDDAILQKMRDGLTNLALIDKNFSNTSFNGTPGGYLAEAWLLAIKVCATLYMV